MTVRKLSNNTLSQYRYFLKLVGCELTRISSGHEVWQKNGLTRPIVFQTHIEPVPEFIIKNALKALGMNKNEFFEVLNKK